MTTFSVGTAIQLPPRVFGVDYQFLSCGDVFTKGLENAAMDFDIAYRHAAWDAEDLDLRISAFRPDLLLVVHGRRFTQRFCAGMGCRSAVWLLDEPYEVDDTATFSRHFDHVFVNDKATLGRHPRASYLPVCYDPYVHVSADGPKVHAVGFVGGANPRRERVLGALAQAKLLSYVVGGYWSDPAINAVTLSDNVPPAVTAKLYASTRIVVNVFREQHHYNAAGVQATAMNPRIYEALACGALVVSEWREEIARRIPSLPMFRSDAECVEIVRALLAEPDAAELVRARCADQLKGDTYAQRLSTVLKTMAVEVAT
jgi:hypothetical protein